MSRNPTPPCDPLQARQHLLWHPWQRDVTAEIIVPLLVGPNDPNGLGLHLHLPGLSFGRLASRSQGRNFSIVNCSSKETV